MKVMVFIMKIMFLDVDGVMCTARSQLAFGDDTLLMQAWDITVCQMLRVLCAKHDLKIVITSDWRSQPQRLRTYLATYGLIEKIYGDDVFNDGSIEWKTKRLPYKDEDANRHVRRGLEIQEWLNRHQDVSNYIIIDDDSDMLDVQHTHFFQVKDGAEGFSSQNFIDICNYFNTDM